MAQAQAGAQALPAAESAQVQPAPHEQAGPQPQDAGAIVDWQPQRQAAPSQAAQAQVAGVAAVDSFMRDSWLGGVDERDAVDRPHCRPARLAVPAAWDERAQAVREWSWSATEWAGATEVASRGTRTAGDTRPERGRRPTNHRVDDPDASRTLSDRRSQSG